MFNKFFEWFFEPLGNLLGNNNCNDTLLELLNNKSADEEVTEPLIVTRKTVCKSFRPQTFSQYIGQTEAKENLSAYIENMKKRQQVMPHTLIYGSAGTGKTTLARIIANELGVKFYELISSKITDINEIVNIIQELNGGILFADEIHGLERNTAELFYPIMEDFKFGDIELPKFTLIGATTEIGEILKTRKPFYDRFKIKQELEDYTAEDLECIIRQYKLKTFPDDIVDENIIKTVASNCRGIPRRAISLLENCIYLGLDIDNTLKNNQIVKDGVTKKDVKILTLLSKYPKGLGLLTLSAYLDMNQSNYLEQYENFLMKNEYMIKGNRGRIISDKGIKLLSEITK